MLLSYQYKFRHSNQQLKELSGWLGRVTITYNWGLREIIERGNQEFIQVDYCDLKTRVGITRLTGSLVRGTKLDNPGKTREDKAKKAGEKDKSPQRSASLMQEANLINLKASDPWYRNIDDAVLPSIPARINESLNKFFNAGFPKFKGRHDVKLFSYKPGHVKIKGSKIYLPKIGWMCFYNSRSIPDGFDIRTVTVKQKADGWYVSVRIENKTVPDFSIISDSEIKTITGCDMGLTKLVYLSEGSVDRPGFATDKNTKGLMRVRQQRVSRQQKESKNRSKAQLKVTALHNKIQQKREAYLWWVANKLIKKYDAVAAEELPIENMMKRCQPIKSNTGRCLPNNQPAKRGLNRSLSDASWYDLTKKLEYLAAKSGKRLDKVNPQYTSQTCSKCSHIDRDSRNGEKFICTNCGHIDDAILQAARNVKTKAIEAYGLTIVKKIRAKMVRVDCSKPVQLNLFEIELCEGLPDNTLPQKGSVACGREPR
jgi:putative transposase